MALKPESRALLDEAKPRKRRTQQDADALTRPIRPRGMNKWEKLYAERLEVLKQAGEVVWYAYEPINMRLPGQRHHYKPDFLVVRLVRGLVNMNRYEVVEIHEVKGLLRATARNKLKVAAALHPWARFYLATRPEGKTRSGWDVRPIPKGE